MEISKYEVFGGIGLTLFCCYLFGNVVMWASMLICSVIMLALLGIIGVKAWFWWTDCQLDITERKVGIQYQVHGGHYGAYLALDAGKGAFQHFTAGGRSRREPGADIGAIPTIEAAEPTPDLISVIRDMQTLFIYGSMGSGKSTLLSHLAGLRLSAGHEVYAVDPHYSLNDPMPEGVHVIGAGRDYQYIKHFLDWVVREMDDRYNNPGGMKPMTIILDEFTNYRKKVPTMPDFIEAAFCEMRKAKMNTIFGAHSRRSKIMGTKGMHDMTDGLCFVNLKIVRQFDIFTACRFPDDMRGIAHHYSGPEVE